MGVNLGNCCNFRIGGPPSPGADRVGRVASLASAAVSPPFFGGAGYLPPAAFDLAKPAYGSPRPLAARRRPQAASPPGPKHYQQRLSPKFLQYHSAGHLPQYLGHSGGSDHYQRLSDSFKPGMKEVPQWLKSLRLHKYTALFQTLSYSEMLALDERQLERRDVTQGARRKILQSIQRLRDRSRVLLELDARLRKQPGADAVFEAVQELCAVLGTPICAVDEGFADGPAPSLQACVLRLLGSTFGLLFRADPGRPGQAGLTWIADECALRLLHVCERVISHEAFEQNEKMEAAGHRQIIRRYMQSGGGMRRNSGAPAALAFNGYVDYRRLAAARKSSPGPADAAPPPPPPASRFWRAAKTAKDAPQTPLFAEDSEEGSEAGLQSDGSNSASSSSGDEDAGCCADQSSPPPPPPQSLGPAVGSPAGAGRNLVFNGYLNEYDGFTAAARDSLVLSFLQNMVQLQVQTAKPQDPTPQYPQHYDNNDKGKWDRSADEVADKFDSWELFPRDSAAVAQRDSEPEQSWTSELVEPVTTSVVADSHCVVPDYGNGLDQERSSGAASPMVYDFSEQDLLLDERSCRAFGAGARYCSSTGVHSQQFQQQNQQQMYKLF